MDPAPLHRRTISAWGTIITIDIVSDVVVESIVDTTTRAIAQDVDYIFSTWRDDSVISHRRRGLDTESDIFDAVLRKCERAKEISEGAYDPWMAPGGLDLSGFVKGWAAARMADALVALGYPNVCVNAAGDLAARGERRPGTGWMVGVAHPFEPQQVCARVAVPLVGGSAATSGFSEQTGHIVNPRTGRDDTAAVQATVIGPEGGLADALATGLLIDGLSGAQWFADFAAARTHEQWRAIVIQDGTLWRLGGRDSGSGTKPL